MGQLGSQIFPDKLCSLRRDDCCHQTEGAIKAKAYFLWPIIMLLEELGCTGLKNRISNYYIDDEFKKLKAANKML